MSEGSGRPRRGLGRGLDALLGSTTPALDAALARPVAAAREEGGLVEIPVDRVRPNPEQPRQHFDDASLAELAASIREHGLLQPVTVEPDGDAWRLVAGERRLRACTLAGRTTVPAVVRPRTESGRHALELALVENLQRTDLSALEEASAYARLADTFGMSHEAIGLRVGRSRQAVTNTMRLLNLAPAVQRALAEGRITAGHARALLAVTDAEGQEALAYEAAEHGLTVRQVERAAQELARGVETAPPARRPSVEASPATPDDQALVRALEEAVGTPVALRRGRRGGRLVIEFYSDDQLDEIYRRLGGRPL